MHAACRDAGCHYVDITGEIAVFEAAHAEDAAARAAGVVVCPGVGFDVIPGAGSRGSRRRTATTSPSTAR